MNYWEVGFNQSYRCCSQKVLLISLWLRPNENIDYKNHRDWLQIVELITVAKIREQTIKKWLLQTDSAIIVGWGGFAVQWELTLHLHYCNRVIQRSIQTLQHVTQLKIVHLCLNVSHLKSQHLWAESRGDDGGMLRKCSFEMKSLTFLSAAENALAAS